MGIASIIGDGFNLVISKIAAVLDWFNEFVVNVLTSVVDMVKDLACWVFEQVLTLVITILGAFDFSALAQWSAHYGDIPSGVVEVCSAIGLTTAFGIIVSAISIRIMLQLVPFTRLGS